jgi:hypothetical protein
MRRNRHELPEIIEKAAERAAWDTPKGVRLDLRLHVYPDGSDTRGPWLTIVDKDGNEAEAVCQGEMTNLIALLVHAVNGAQRKANRKKLKNVA